MAGEVLTIEDNETTGETIMRKLLVVNEKNMAEKTLIAAEIAVETLGVVETLATAETSKTS